VAATFPEQIEIAAYVRERGTRNIDDQRLGHQRQGGRVLPAGPEHARPR
jgi:hypothetical protein